MPSSSPRSRASISRIASSPLRRRSRCSRTSSGTSSTVAAARCVAIDGDSLMGFASAWSRGDDWFLASLFVAPAAQQGGIGQALLDAVWGDGHARRRTITDAIQPVSNALYARRGLVPATPVLSFSGTPCTGKPWAGAAPLTGSWHLADSPGETVPLDAVAYGFDRAVDHAYWSGLARRTIWARDATVVAYSYAFPRGHIGPVAGLDAEAAAGALEGELAQAIGPVVVRIPGSSRSLVQVALRRGLRLSPTPGLLLLSRRRRTADLTRSLGLHALLSGTELRVNRTPCSFRTLRQMSRWSLGADLHDAGPEDPDRLSRARRLVRDPGRARAGRRPERVLGVASVASHRRPAPAPRRAARDPRRRPRAHERRDRVAP